MGWGFLWQVGLQFGAECDGRKPAASRNGGSSVSKISRGVGVADIVICGRFVEMGCAPIMDRFVQCLESEFCCAVRVSK